MLASGHFRFHHPPRTSSAPAPPPTTMLVRVLALLAAGAALVRADDRCARLELVLTPKDVRVKRH